MVLTWELLHNLINLEAFHINYEVVFSFPTFHKPKNDVKQVMKTTVGTLSLTLLNFYCCYSNWPIFYRMFWETLWTPYTTPKITLLTSVKINLTRDILQSYQRAKSNSI